MAKIDTGAIKGFEEMSAEDKLNALLNYEMPDAAPESGEVDKLKALLNKSNGEAAEYKRQLKAKMSEAEQKEAERAEAEKQMRDELAALKRDKITSGYAANLLGIGYDAETAQKISAMLPDDVPDEFFAAHKAFADQLKKNVEAELLKKQPNLSNGAPPAGANFEDQLTADMRRWAGLPTK